MGSFHDILIDADKRIYVACLGLITSIGFLGNALLAITVFIRRLESKFTTYMIRSQAIIDSTVCFFSLMLVIFPNPLKSGNYILDLVICRIWTSQGLVWLLVLSSVYNLVFTAFDRYWAVLTPQNYKQNITRKLCISYSVIVGMCTIITLPSFLQSKFKDGNCTSELQYDQLFVKTFFKAYSVLWFFSIYGVPATIMIYIYTKVLWQLHKTVKGNNESNSAMRSFTKGTLVATGIFLVTISYDAIYYMLGYLEVIIYKFNTPIQVVGVFLTAVNSAKNPIVYFVFVKSFRHTLSLIWRKCITQRNMKVSDKPMCTFSST